MKRVVLYSLYERIWHWLQAVAIIVLSLTGVEIHAPDRLHVMGFAAASRVHEVAALFTIANGFLALFTHLATGAIREYIPAPQDVFTQGFLQARYYLRGIFRGEPHPFARRPGKKLNVLQQITYLMILNLLLPTQIVIGVLLWEAARLPMLVDSLGGLTVIASVHVAAAWLFIAFIVMHVYLTTTGSTPLAHIRSMITGCEEDCGHDDNRGVGGDAVASRRPPGEVQHEPS
jgi:thiosulfate reductase cytochrome b subunit